MFKRAIQRFGETPEPVTPYQKAVEAWDRRVGSATVQAANWRYIAFGAMAVSLVLSGGMVWLAGQSRVVPYVVEVDKSGEPKAVGPAAETYSPSDAQIAWFLAHFITNVRSLSIDPVLVRSDWLEAYDFTTDHAAQFLNAQAQQHDPFAGVGERSVTVQVTNVVRASKTSFQVKWIEQTYERGVLTGTDHWTAILGIVEHTPQREDVLRKNPLGLYIDELAWSKDYSPVEPSKPTAAPSVTTAAAQAVADPSAQR